MFLSKIATCCGLLSVVMSFAGCHTDAHAPRTEWISPVPDFYVAPDGNDRWSGRLANPNAANTDGPFATLSRARDAARALKIAESKKDTLVQIRGGVYRLTDTLLFSSADSAAIGGTITYAAYKSETPVFTSAVPILDWKKPENPSPLLSEIARDKVWVADVPTELTMLLSLYDGNVRLRRAWSKPFAPVPVKDQAAKPHDALYFPPGAIKNWPDLTNGELRVIPSCDYEMCLLPLASVDEATGMAKTTVPASRTMGPVKFLSETMWVENILEVLDEPGEWVYNAAERKVYLWPISDAPSDSIVAPKLTELVRVEGEIDYDGPADKPVTGLIFRGLTFTCGERRPWHGGTPGELQHKWEHFDAPTALLRFRGAENCSVIACRFIDTSGTGLRFDLTSLNNKISGNEVARTGGAGILVAGYGPGTKDVSKHNSVTSNWVHHVGEIYWASPAIMVWQSGENKIEGNLIHNTPYSGITVSGRTGWTAESETTFRAKEVVLPDYDRLPGRLAGSNSVHQEWWSAREPYMHGRKNYVAYNEIHHVMERMGDGNAIYISGTGKGNHIYRNYIHHMDGDGTASGIRCDNDQYETVIEGNVLYKVRSAQSGISTTEMNHIINNFIIDVIPSRRPITPPNIVHGYISVPNETWPFAGARIQRNIIWSPRKDYWPIVEHKSFADGAGDRLIGTETDNNLYWCPEDPQWGQRHINEQRTRGLETHSVCADPLFIDVENGDLRLAPRSPAKALGIETWNTAEAGLTVMNPYYPAKAAVR